MQTTDLRMPETEERLLVRVALSLYKLRGKGGTQDFLERHGLSSTETDTILHRLSILANEETMQNEVRFLGKLPPRRTRTVDFRRQSERNALHILAIWIAKNDFTREDVIQTIRELGTDAEIPEMEMETLFMEAADVSLENFHEPS